MGSSVTGGSAPLQVSQRSLSSCNSSGSNASDMVCSSSNCCQRLFFYGSLRHAQTAPRVDRKRAFLFIAGHMLMSGNILPPRSILQSRAMYAVPRSSRPSDDLAGVLQ